LFGAKVRGGKAGKPAIVHLSHTDIRVDARIQRAISAGRNTGVYSVVSLGFPRKDKTEPGGASIGAFWFPKNLILSGLGQLRRIGALRDFRFLTVQLIFNLVTLVRLLNVLFRQKVAIVHLHDAFLLPVAVLAQKTFGFQLVYDAHELESRRTGLSFFLQAVTERTERYSWSSVSFFITVSEEILEWYLNKFGPKQGEVVLNAPLTTQVSAEQVPTDDLRSRVGIAPEANLLVSVGDLTPGRGVESILEAFEAVDENTHIVFLGGGLLVPHVRREATMRKNVHYLSPVPHSELVALLATADAGVCLIEAVSLSYRFSLPNKLFEYATARIPVLATDQPAIRRIVETYGLGIVTSLDVEKLRAGFSEVLRFPLDKIRDLSAISGAAQVEKMSQIYGYSLGETKLSSPVP